ncbi:MAG: metallophosphoesterase [Bryobacteraceae bacterium]
MSKYILDNREGDGIDRRGFLECMAWAGTGLLVSMSGGVARSQTISGAMHNKHMSKSELDFVQISDSHIGFNKDANKDVTATLQEAVNRINALPTPPAFILHTGDITHLSKPEQFDTATQVLKGAKTGEIFYVPGEHDVLAENGKSYLNRYGKNKQGDGWFSFDHNGVHFIGLVNVIDLKPGGMGSLGPDQFAWLEKDVKKRSASTPIVVFAHVPLWTVYEKWGWGTGDGMQAMSYLKRFGSVTVLNGHIHQTMRKVEGNITFHTADSTAFPQPRPGEAPSPGPMTVPTDRLRAMLGLTEVSYVRGNRQLAIMDSPLGAEDSHKSSVAANRVEIDNFSFAPAALTVPAGTEVVWTNRDDIPHTIVATDKSFRSPALDTSDKFSHVFAQPGEYEYYCSLHPKMTGKLIVMQ